MSQMDPVVYTGEGASERFGVKCQDFGATVGVLWFQEGSLTYGTAQAAAIMAFPGMWGAYPLLLFAMRKRLSFAQFNPQHFGIDNDRSRHGFVEQAVELRHTWELAVPTAAAIERSEVAEYIAAHSHYPLCVRAACLHRVTDAVYANHVITAAHSRFWRKDAHGKPAEEMEVLGTTAAYVHAMFARIRIDDADGLRHIRTQAAGAVLMQSGKVPWVAERLKVMDRLGL